MYVLDTNVLSELRQGKRGQSRAVRAWAASVQPGELYLTSISILELERGILLLARRDPAQGQIIRTWFDAVRSSFAGRVLAFSEQAAILCANLHIPDPQASSDSMIASIALEHRFQVVTRNVRDFEKAGVGIFNPWEFSG